MAIRLEPRVQRASLAWLLIPLLIIALVAVTLGVVASHTVRSPYATPFFHLFFSDTLHMKVWLVSASLLLGFFQLLTASRIYGLLRFPPQGRLYNIVHRWSGRVAIALTLPVAYHCIFLLGLDLHTIDTRVLVHSLLGCGIYGTFISKVLLVRSSKFPAWALPVMGGLLFTIILGLWVTSALWFFTTFGVGI
jgi:uncharacterized protein DUF6529